MTIDRDLADLHPLLEPLARDFFRQMPNAFPTETWRDPHREDQLHAEGKTPATGKTCKHCFCIGSLPASKAFDFLIKDLDGRIISDGTDAAYTAAGALIEQLGMVWGGRFPTPDYDHAEIA